ncbi:copper resistance protein NlpE N-terminal domain-containing protein [Acinetobacter sp. BSP-53]|uniref:copper resistance protein NlpE N-terminal domain-containing protein n=1 Tax=Acinetobacter sp. BSP-53 TaxID=3344662 RepID=UPI00376F5FC8
MKKTMITLSFCSLLCLSGCDKPNSPLIQDHAKTNDHLSKPQNLKTPNWTGHYKVFIPCKACEKKLFSIQLHPNQTYTLKEIQFFKQKTKQKQSSGTFSFDPQNSRLIQLTEDKSNKMRYLSWHDQFLELRDRHKNQRKDFEKYQIPKIQKIEVNNALKHVDIQADLFKTEKIRSNKIESTKLTYFFEINNHSDRALKIRDSDIVLVDDKNNEYPASIDNSPVPPIQPNKTNYHLVSFIHSESSPRLYIKIK